MTRTPIAAVSPGGAWRQLSVAGPVVRLLVLTQLAFNLGFFMVLPYLSVHLARDLGLAASVVGLALGLRTFSQQGLFLLGGVMADRFGTAPVVLTGCVLRVGGFVGLALSSSVVGVLAATVVTGFAAALFSPAVEAALSLEAGEQERAAGPSRASAFALFSVGGQVGAFTGPLLGALLLLVNFRAACLVAAGVFVLVLLAHLRWLPRRPPAHAGEPLLAGWREVARNRRFVLFALAFSGQLLAYNQLYLLLPLEVERLWGSQTLLGWLFALSSLLVVLGQLRLTARLRHLPIGHVLVGGFGLLSASFAVVAATLPLELTGALGTVPVVAFVLLLTLGQMVVLPFARDLVPRLVGERRLGTSYGLLATAGGAAVLVGSTATGVLLQQAPASVAWTAAASVPILCAIGLRRVLRD